MGESDTRKGESCDQQEHPGRYRILALPRDELHPRSERDDGDQEREPGREGLCRGTLGGRVSRRSGRRVVHAYLSFIIRRRGPRAIRTWPGSAFQEAPDALLAIRRESRDGVDLRPGSNRRLEAHAVDLVE